MVNAVTYILGNNAGVQALVEVKTQTGLEAYYKVFPVVAPSNETAPYIAVRLASRVQMGKSCNYDYTILVVCYENSYDEVTALADAAKTALEGQASGTINGVDFGFLNLVDESDDYVKEHNLFAKILTYTGAAE